MGTLRTWGLWNSRCDRLIITVLRKSGRKGIKGECIELFQNFAINKKKMEKNCKGCGERRKVFGFYGISLYTYMYICICIYVYLYMYIDTCMYGCVYMDVYVYIYIYIRVCVCVCVCVCGWSSIKGGIAEEISLSR